MTSRFSPLRADTPANGDFASYVERLTAPGPHMAQPGQQLPHSPMVRPMDVRMKPGPLPPEFLRWVEPQLPSLLPKAQRFLRTVRVVVLVLTVLHAISWFAWSRGSLPIVIIMAGIWWSLGALMQALPAWVDSLRMPTLPPPTLKPHVVLSKSQGHRSPQRPPIGKKK